MQKPLITFIIPTIGRDTLERTLKSLVNQTKTNWKAIVVFDGVEKSIDIKDERIKILKIDKLGTMNYAGKVRNAGIKEADTEWIGFLDDDDTISSKYIERLEEEISLNKDAKCIIFRMLLNMRVLPNPIDKNFIVNNVGISFAMKRDLNYNFIPDRREDYHLLDNIRKNKHKMIISPYVNYFVRSPINKFMDNNIYERIIINP